MDEVKPSDAVQAIDAASEPDLPLGRVRLAAELVATGLYSNSKVAEIIGVHPATISRWLKEPRFHEACVAYGKAVDKDLLREAPLARAGLVLAKIEALADQTRDDAVRARLLTWLWEQGLGKAQQRIEHSVAPAAPQTRLDELDRAIVDARAEAEAAAQGRISGVQRGPIVDVESTDLEDPQAE